MPAPIIPWAPSNIPVEIQQELMRRKRNRSFEYVSNGMANWDFSGDSPSATNDWNAYKGPMVSWIRVCSNGEGRKFNDASKNKPRFVLYGGKGFYQTYGFSNPAGTSANQQIIGYAPPINTGDPMKVHTIENSLITPMPDNTSERAFGTSGNYPIHVPTPEISRLEVGIYKELLRRLTIEWVCFSWKQLEYMTPYFLVPGITVMVEWGWNHFNKESLVDLTNVYGPKPNMRSLWNDAYPLYTNNILKSRGNYDVTYGIITNFNWSVEGSKIICSTEITSKDRLYAGVAKNTSLMKKANKLDDELGWLTSIQTFVNYTKALQNFQALAESKTLLTEADLLAREAYEKKSDSPRYVPTPAGPVPVAQPSPPTPPQPPQATSVGGKTVDNSTWVDMAKRAYSDPVNKNIRVSYLHGCFFGRIKSAGDANDDLYSISKPADKDFDKIDAPVPEKFWLCMGLIVELLNFFSQREGIDNEPMFKVDITNSVIGAHPNLISCKPDVLIPNYQAPKYHYGSLGVVDNAALQKKSFWGLTQDPNKTPYELQYVGDGVIKTASTKADNILGKTFYQFAVSPGKVYRSNLDKWINWYRYNREYSGGDFSFPSKTDGVLDIPGRGKLKIEKDKTGLLANIYISYKAFHEIVNRSDIHSYFDIYKGILDLLMDASDDFWELGLVEDEGKWTISDRKLTVGANFYDKNGTAVGPLWSFDYYDSDSIIKSFKFRPALTDAQATRAIYGSANNPNSTYTYEDAHDLLSYQFKDYVIVPEPKKDDGTNPRQVIDKTKSFYTQLRDMVRSHQIVDSPNETCLQMTVPPEQAPRGEKKEIIKLVLVDQELLRLILRDDDKENNPVYSAIQPGIVAEITILGLGGLRTFQYFLVKNLPAPYSHTNVVFRTIDVHHSLEAGHWETTIRAGLIPLTDYIKNRIGYPKDQKTSI